MWLVPFELATKMLLQPSDPPAMTLLYTITFVLVIGTAAYLMLRKLRNRKRVAMPDPVAK
jgi:hypothetical protein